MANKRIPSEKLHKVAQAIALADLGPGFMGEAGEVYNTRGFDDLRPDYEKMARAAILAMITD